MARIQLRDASVILQDGTSGTAAVNDVAGIVATDTTAEFDTIVLNTADIDLVPIGARLTFAADTTVYTVTARTPASTSPTTNITFTPAKIAPTAADDSVITVLAQRLTIKVGEVPPVTKHDNQRGVSRVTATIAATFAATFALCGPVSALCGQVRWGREGDEAKCHEESRNQSNGGRHVCSPAKEAVFLLGRRTGEHLPKCPQSDLWTRPSLVSFAGIIGSVRGPAPRSPRPRYHGKL